DQIELLPRNIALVMMTKMLHMITNFFDSSLSNYLVKIKDTKQLLKNVITANPNANQPTDMLMLIHWMIFKISSHD
ncbi:hypothetical protein ACODRQ_14945, partial [Lactiplantibacillus plantarum]|uniref:hypothetical protein n=4 Tax=Lactiplantibacillus plantarum TaxID=1590 RepID=UPI003B43416D